MKYSKRVQKMCHSMFLSDIDGVTCVTQNLLREGGGGVHDTFKINHTTFLRKCMSIGYLKPLAKIKQGKIKIEPRIKLNYNISIPPLWKVF